jgi:hypothetical protein
MTELLQEQLQETAPVVNPQLVGKITALLAAAGHPNPALWESQVHPDAHNVCDHGIQRFLINRYWRETLGSLDADTINARYCLLAEGSIPDWERAFSEGVVPCIIKNNVPALIH